MDIQSLLSGLSSLALKDVKYFDTIGSTNEFALNWAKSGEADNCLVVSEEQTAGKGRMGRKWVTAANASLAFSYILYPNEDESKNIRLFSPLGSLAVAEVLRQDFGISNVNLKWPNDILIDQQKVSGVLVESAWYGEKAQAVVIGIGINIQSSSIPPTDQLLYPATCVEDHSDKTIDRIDFMNRILKSMFAWRARINSEEFLTAWDEFLAFRGQWVHVQQTNQWSIDGELIGIDKFGNLKIRTDKGSDLCVAYGDVSLRPIQKPE